MGIEHGHEGDHQASGAHIYINRASVGTTINLMIAASTEGTTILENAAKEPEIVDLAIFLNGMGAKVGAGTETIRSRASRACASSTHYPDRTRDISRRCNYRRGCPCESVAEHLSSLLLEEAGVPLPGDNEPMQLFSARLNPVDVETPSHPGFPTDLQQPLVAAMCLADGTSVVRKPSSTASATDELRRMGADIKIEQKTAIIRGVPQLTGAPVEITDLRAGAALAIAALAAEGRTEL